MKYKASNITNIDENFEQWYIDVIKHSQLIDYGLVKGTMFFKPYGWKLWELIQNQLNKRFVQEKVENVNAPLFISQDLIQKEKEHISGFAPELLTINQYGDTKIDEPFYIRPTSEALFMDQFKKEITSYQSLPLIWNQWCSVVRWEKRTRPFLRSNEFHWQEGHSVHESAKQAHDLTKKMLDHYYFFIEKMLLIPVFKGLKTKEEKFAGAKQTYTIEAVMKNGKALQCATSHYFGDSFAKAYDIKFRDNNNKLKYCHTTSWGLSTRIIGAIIMVHGDNQGLVLPPDIAPVQVIILPLLVNKNNSLLILKKAREIKQNLNIYRTKIDASTKSLGFKSIGAEIQGIPLRIEIGPRDLAKNIVTIVKRNTKEKFQFSLHDDIKQKVTHLLQEIKQEMFVQALTIKNFKTTQAISYQELKTQAKKGYVLAWWCGLSLCEKNIKKESGITIRCIVAESKKKSTTNYCVYCQKLARKKVYFAFCY